MEVMDVRGPEFKAYGRVIEGYDVSGLMKAMESTPLPDGCLLYTSWMDGTNMVVGTTPEGDYIIQRTLVDITARKTLQQQLDREQEMYRVAMEASAAVMYEYLMDSDTFISYEPRLGEGILRGELHPYSKALVEQQIVHPDDVPMVIDNICKGRAEAFEVRCATPGGKKGEYIWYRVNSRLIQEDGKPGRVAVSYTHLEPLGSCRKNVQERPSFH